MKSKSKKAKKSAPARARTPKKAKLSATVLKKALAAQGIIMKGYWAAVYGGIDPSEIELKHSKLKVAAVTPITTAAEIEGTGVVEKAG